MSGLSQLERDLISQRTKEGLKVQKLGEEMEEGLQREMIKPIQ